MSWNKGHFVLQSGGDITYLGPFQQIKSIQTVTPSIPPLGKLKEIAQKTKVGLKIDLHLITKITFRLILTQMHID